ncbi:MBL fold metallo-hydrolase [Candidatus Uhrbacteria bacterium]|nr:MBL fold metallo-hydrolase [Candidatus Uhrbacteria bacterium]
MALEVSFHGAAEGVTGSCHLVTTPAGKILVDCGMFQGDVFASRDNARAFGFDPKEVRAVFITHPHADHTGRLPKLLKEGFVGTVYMVPPCRPLSRLILEDSVQIMAEEAEREGVTALFSAADVAHVYECVETVGYHTAVQPLPGVSVMFHEAGHVLGSAYISIETEGQRIVFSGDIGNDDVPILPPTEPLSKADVVVCESTYGDRTHEAMSRRRAKLMAAISDTVAKRGVLLIPAFSIERTQELLYEIDQILLQDLKTNVPIFLDSPMAIRATQTYRDSKEYLRFDVPMSPDGDFFSFPNLRETLRVEESKAINDVAAPKVIIAGSGMMNGGRIMHHLRRYLPHASTHLLIIGYQARGTTGRKIFDGAKEVKIFGERVPVAATVSAIGAFSAHGDKDKLTRWLQPEDGKTPKKIILVHGDPEQKKAFAEHLRATLGTEVLVPKMDERAIL